MILFRMVNRIALLFAVVVLIASCTTAPPRNPAELKADQGIELEVSQQLANAPNLYSRHIEVSVDRGVVTLSGFVFESGDPAEAVRIVASVPGVISVSNQMELQIGGVGLPDR